ncbi:methyltransferase [Allokutzneria sp. A3M-2-11 16]|uniref:methyltransferase n=1 Tax=Allokutzneria sp. A3M-2-11 16 TaxID=2962043 RepID=UPI0020B72E85|nr:methyltransferase [Allokutzneria sp. A3M-2-11 16]MCP3801287.1 methyltransferase [Allokutzneria sp. A3M-2-11 16]
MNVTDIGFLRRRIEEDDAVRSTPELREALDSGAPGVGPWLDAFGDRPERNLVLFPLRGIGSDIVLATLLAGGTVVLGDPGAHPARTLALLERSGATAVTLPSKLLERLNSEPSAPMTDFAELRRIFYVGEPTRFDFPGPELSRVDTLTFEHVSEFVARFRDAVLASMLLTLQANDVLRDPAISHTGEEILTAARVAERHHGVVERWLTALTEHGVLVRQGDRFLGTEPIDADAVAQAWDEAEKLWTGHLGAAEVAAYFRRNAERLPQLMTGEEQATLLLFPEGRTDIADALYRDTAVARYLNARVSETVQRLGAKRILEVGAGTGATSEVVIRDLADRADVDYLFTDLSAFFLTTAKERFADYPWVRFGIYDIDTQDSDEPGAFDVIIAAGVLNNARDADATLSRLKALLVPGGSLLIIEPTREYYEILISQAFMMTAAEDVRLRSGTMFLSRQQWVEAIDRAGLSIVDVTPDDTHPLSPMSQYLFVARH